MASRTRSLLRSKKAQFFVLSAFVIVTIIFFMSQWIEPYTIIDTSSVALMDEMFIFNNIKEKAIYTIRQSKDCDELNYNLAEYRYFVEEHILKKGYNLNMNYTIAPCPKIDSPTVVAFKVALISSSSVLQSNFTLGWPA